MIPGCGTAHEVIRAFCTAGFAVRAIDFSPIAVQETKTALGPLADNVLLGDFFHYDFDRTRFDIVYERTFLCALSPERWKEYGARVAELLRPGGRLAGIFFYGEEDDPPPYPLNDRRAREVFAEHFRLDRSDAVTDSLPVFAGNERWQEWISVAD